MYYSFFGLNQPPFKITPDTRLFFPGGNRGAVLEALVYAVANGEGIVKVVGEVGSGKTMLCRMLELKLPPNTEIVYLANPSLSPEDILHAIAMELKLPLAPGDGRLQVMQALQAFLLRKHAENRRVVVFVEEAQSMPLATLEEIRFLSNLETQQDKLLQIVLFGQPELDEHLAAKHIRQLRERITHNFQLTPFRPEEVREYVNSRLRASGYMSTDIFTPAAIRAITRCSRGLLRRINILADKSMLAAYAANSHTVGPRHVRMAARDSDFDGARPLSPGLVPAALSVVLAVTAGLGGWWWLGNGAGGGPFVAAEAEANTAAEPAGGGATAVDDDNLAPEPETPRLAVAAEPLPPEPAMELPEAPTVSATGDEMPSDFNRLLFTAWALPPAIDPLVSIHTIGSLQIRGGQKESTGP